MRSQAKSMRIGQQKQHVHFKTCLFRQAVRLILHSVSDSPILVEEKKWRYVFSSQTHRLLCLSPDRGKLPREGPRPSARLEHGRTLGPSPSRRAVGLAHAFGPALL